jgi:methyl-accepting chemotaxis protein
MALNSKQKITKQQTNPQQQLIDLYNQMKKEWSKIKDLETKINNQFSITTIKASNQNFQTQQKKFEKVLGEVKEDPKFDKIREDYEILKEEYEQNMPRMNNSITRLSSSAASSNQGQALVQTQDQVSQKILDQQAEITYIGGAAKEIKEDMQYLNNQMYELKDLIDDQHNKLVRIDNIIVEAKDHMIAGNTELEKAEESQSKCFVS